MRNAMEASAGLLYRIAQCAVLNLREDPADRLLGFQVQLVRRTLRYKPPEVAKIDAAISNGPDALIALLLQPGEDGDCMRRIAPLHALVTKHQRAAVVRRHVNEDCPTDMRPVIFTLIAVLGGRCTDALAGTSGKGYTYADAKHLSPERCRVLRFAATMVDTFAALYSPGWVRRWFNARAPRLLMCSPRARFERESADAIEPVWELVLADLRTVTRGARRLH